MLIKPSRLTIEFCPTELVWSQSVSKIKRAETDEMIRAEQSTEAIITIKAMNGKKF